MADGEVIFADDTKSKSETGYGNRLVLKFTKNGKTYYANYCHLSEITIKKGKVKAGDILGKTGATGNACKLFYETGPKKGVELDPQDMHLHFELNTENKWPKGLGTRFDPIPHCRAKLTFTR